MRMQKKRGKNETKAKLEIHFPLRRAAARRLKQQFMRSVCHCVYCFGPCHSNHSALIFPFDKQKAKNEQTEKYGIFGLACHGSELMKCETIAYAFPNGQRQIFIAHQASGINTETRHFLRCHTVRSGIDSGEVRFTATPGQHKEQILFWFFARTPARSWWRQRIFDGSMERRGQIVICVTHLRYGDAN